MVIHMMKHPPVCQVVNVAQHFLRKQSFTGKTSRVLSLSQKLLGQLKFLISQSDRIASPQILKSCKNCYYTCSTNEPSLMIKSCQVRFLVYIFGHSVTTYSVLAGTHVRGGVSSKTKYLIRLKKKNF